MEEEEEEEEEEAERAPTNLDGEHEVEHDRVREPDDLRTGLGAEERCHYVRDEQRPVAAPPRRRGERGGRVGPAHGLRTDHAA